MLFLDAEICFILPDGDSPQGLTNDVDTSNIIRPAINFGNNLLFSGTMIAESNVKKLIRGEKYRVSIEMPTVDKAPYEEIKDLVEVGNTFRIQAASKVIGNGKILDYVFV